MTQQTESTRKKISFILEQVGMSDEELYQLLYGRKQSIEIDIRLPQLMDEEIWQATEHSAEELAAIENKIVAVETLLDSSMDSAALAQLEALLEGEVITDDARGLLLKKRFPNWRKGMGQFLAFLQFSSLVKLALAMANITANHLIPNFENAKNRPQDRRMLADFILQQLEKPSPPMIAALVDVGGVLSHTGALEFMQPMTAVIIGLDDDKLKKLQAILQNHQESENTFYATTDEYTDKEKALKRTQKATSVLNKLFVLDRVEDVIANQQALQPQPQQQTDVNNPQQVVQQEQPRRRGSSGRRQREALERQEREMQEQRARNDANPQPDQPQQPRSFQRFTNRSQPRQEPAPVTQNNRPPVTNANPNNPLVTPQQSMVSSARTNNANTPSTPTAPAKTTNNAVEAKPMPIIPPTPRQQTPVIETHEQHKMANIFASLPLDAFKGIKVEHVDNKELGKAKSSVAKDNAINTPTKPITQIER